jgi:rhamnosyltransferase subunit B
VVGQSALHLDAGHFARLDASSVERLGHLTHDHPPYQTYRATMARIVLFCWGSHGDVDPYLGLAHGLRARGHSVAICTMEFYRHLIRGEGFDFFPLRPSADPADEATVRRIMDTRHGSEYLLKEIISPAIRPMYEDVCVAARDADLLVSHALTMAVPIYAELHEVPWMSTVLAPSWFFSKYDLPVVPQAPWLKRLDVLGPWFRHAFMRGARASTSDWMRPIAAFRRKLGLEPAGIPIFEGQHSPHLVLALFSRQLGAPQRDWPANTVLTGHLLHDHAHGTELGEELKAFLCAGPPPVVFTLGTSAVLAPRDFWKESLAAVRALGTRAVFLVGPGNSERMRCTLPPSVLAVDRAPHSLLFLRASVVVHQCGVGTVGQSLRSGCPMLAVPFAHDQFDNAHRVARLGMARILPVDRYRAPRVVKELRELLERPSYVMKARTVAKLVREERGIDTACNAIERTFFRLGSPAGVEGSQSQSRQSASRADADAPRANTNRLLPFSCS